MEDQNSEDETLAECDCLDMRKYLEELDDEGEKESASDNISNPEVNGRIQRKWQESRSFLNED